MINKIFCNLISQIIQTDKSLEKELSSFQSWIPITVVLYIVSEFQEFPKSCHQNTLSTLKSVANVIQNNYDEDVQKAYKLALKNLQKNQKKKKLEKNLLKKK